MIQCALEVVYGKVKRRVLALPLGIIGIFDAFWVPLKDVSSHLCQDLQVLRILLVDSPTRRVTRRGWWVNLPTLAVPDPLRCASLCASRDTGKTTVGAVAAWPSGRGSWGIIFIET